jgi:lipoate-protein ligase A
LRFKHGAIIESCISTSDDPLLAAEQANRVHEALKGRNLHELRLSHWTETLLSQLSEDEEPDKIRELASFIASQFGCS